MHYIRYIYLKGDFSGQPIFLFEIIVIGHIEEEVAGLDYIKDKVAKRTGELCFMLNVRRAYTSHELLVQQELKVFGRLPVL